MNHRPLPVCLFALTIIGCSGIDTDFSLSVSEDASQVPNASDLDTRESLDEENRMLAEIIEEQRILIDFLKRPRTASVRPASKEVRRLKDVVERQGRLITSLKEESKAATTRLDRMKAQELWLSQRVRDEQIRQQRHARRSRARDPWAENSNRRPMPSRIFSITPDDALSDSSLGRELQQQMQLQRFYQILDGANADRRAWENRAQLERLNRSLEDIAREVHFHE